MSRHVPDDRLGAIREHLIRAVKNTKAQLWVSAGKTTLCQAEDLRALLDEVSRRRQSDGKMGSFQLGKTASLLMGMKVGDEVEIEPITQGALTTARRTARKRMDNPEAVWRSYLQDNGLQRIVRAPDGAPVYDKRHNPAADIMAKMKVGQTVILTTVKNRMHNGLKVLARRKMDKAEANWRCTNLANGDVRCTRIF